MKDDGNKFWHVPAGPQEGRQRCNPISCTTLASLPQGTLAGVDQGVTSLYLVEVVLHHGMDVSVIAVGNSFDKSVEKRVWLDLVAIEFQVLVNFLHEGITCLQSLNDGRYTFHRGVLLQETVKVWEDSWIVSDFPETSIVINFIINLSQSSPALSRIQLHCRAILLWTP